MTPTLNNALRLIREFHGLSQTKLAERLGISKSYLSELEAGTKKINISMELLSKYAEIFRIPVSSLLLFSENLDSSKRSEPLRVEAAAKVTRLLSWLQDKESINDEPAQRE